jgi:hypothetical protein
MQLTLIQAHLSFINAPNFESPTDAGHDNIYDVVTQVTDSFGSIDTQTVAVTVIDDNEAPKFFEFCGPSVLEANMVENSVLPIATFATVAATDQIESLTRLCLTKEISISSPSL